MPNSPDAYSDSEDDYPPEDGATYYELEVNPLGTTFDARIDSPDGVRATMRADLSWTCNGLFAAVREFDLAGPPDQVDQAVVRRRR